MIIIKKLFLKLILLIKIQVPKIIGNHFPEVQDKLLNVLQLNENSGESDLILASINQKSKELAPISFVKAIDFKQNKKYLKLAIIPFLIWVISLFTGVNESLTQSLNRVVHHRTSYIPPAPFSFFLVNSDLQVIQGKPIRISVKTVGNTVPNEAKIIFKNQFYSSNSLIHYSSFLFLEKRLNL